MNKDDEILLAQVGDRLRQAENRSVVSHTDFLDLRQRSLVEHELKSRGFTRGLFSGGYEDAERTVCFFFPAWLPEDEEAERAEIAERLKLVKISLAKGAKSLSHRDYLGSLMGLGIKREVVGDILVRPDGADIVILERIAGFIAQNYSKAGRENLSLQISETDDISLTEQSVEEFSDTVASLRLDNVVSSVFRLSRGKAAEAVKSGLVYIDNIQCEKTDQSVSEGAKLVLRGRGKARLTEVGNKSRKDRIFIKFVVYK